MSGLQSALKNSQIDKKNVVMLEEEDLKMVQKALLHTLDDIISVCDRCDIKYQMSGGCALGAIRHKGFIPWDDDLDINMSRTDLNRFLVEFKKLYGDKYWIHIPGESENYDYMIVHIVTKEVRARKIMDSNKKECGLCTDIFIVENTFDNWLLRKIHGYGCMLFRYVLSCIRFHRNKEELQVLFKNDDRLRKYLNTRCRIGQLALVLPISLWAQMTNRWVSICHNNNSKYVVITSGTKHFFGELYDRELFNKSTETLFEGRNVKISLDYDNYLKKLYGNYMEIPPENKREKHVMLELDKDALTAYVSR